MNCDNSLKGEGRDGHMLAPLIVFVYNRVEQTRQTLETVNKNFLADETELFIYSDGPRQKEDIAKVSKVREYLREFEKRNNFKRIQIRESEHNKGLATSIISGVTDIINRYEKVIVLEDDLLTSVNFLNFMNDCLEFYKDNRRVWSIGGTTYKIDSLKGYTKSIYACYRGQSWGWASWKNRWEKVDWEVSDYKEFIKDKRKRKNFQRGGEDIVVGLKRQMEGKTDSWAIRWCYQQFKENMITILPVKTLVKNIGFDGSGVHSGTVDRFHISMPDDTFAYTLEEVEIDENIMKDFRKYYERTLATKILDLLGINIKR